MAGRLITVTEQGRKRDTEKESFRIEISGSSLRILKEFYGKTHKIWAKKYLAVFLLIDYNRD